MQSLRASLKRIPLTHIWTWKGPILPHPVVALPPVRQSLCLYLKTISLMFIFIRIYYFIHFIHVCSGHFRLTYMEIFMLTQDILA